MNRKQKTSVATKMVDNFLPSGSSVLSPTLGAGFADQAGKAIQGFMYDGEPKTENLCTGNFSPSGSSVLSPTLGAGFADQAGKTTQCNSISRFSQIVCFGNVRFND
ncbi:predicted protein [Arabidopsis lyrata subsp. lyrata]|uniref:Predicted protein n=1 Tax=Arabidopsis lyrata subsp. lyrata TaxID=81972 RepID=D7LLH4_ARALL|nr:predicted protein [Arabidopsis lyrata subsp. lyrata]